MSLELILQSISGFRGGCVRVVAVGVEREVEDEKAGGRGEMKRERIHNE